MHIGVGCELTFDFPQATPMLACPNVHFSRFSDLERPDYLATTPAAPVESYRDSALKTLGGGTDLVFPDYCLVIDNGRDYIRLSNLAR